MLLDVIKNLVNTIFAMGVLSVILHGGYTTAIWSSVTIGDVLLLACSLYYHTKTLLLSAFFKAVSTLMKRIFSTPVVHGGYLLIIVIYKIIKDNFNI